MSRISVIINLLLLIILTEYNYSQPKISDSLHYADVLCREADSCIMLGYIDHSIQLLNNSVRIREKYLPERNTDIIIPQLKIASLQCNNRNYQKANQILNQIIINFDKIVFHDSGTVIECHKLIGNIYFLQGAYEHARQYYEKAMKIFAGCGKNNIVYVDLLYQLALVCQYQANYSEAEQKLSEAVGILRKYYSNDSSKVYIYSYCLHRLAHLNHLVGNYQESENNFNEVIDVRKNSLDTVGLAQSKTYLGGLLIDIGRFKEAELQLIQAIDLRKKAVKSGKTRMVEYVESIDALGDLYDRRGEYFLAEEYHKEAIRIYDSLNIPDTLNYSIYLNHMGSCCFYMGDFEKTKYFYEKAEIFVTKILSKNHPEYCIYLPSLANYYMRVGRYSDAEKYLMKILKIREKVFGKNHYSLAHILSALSNLYIKTQKHGKAEEMLKKVIEINKNRYGIENYHYAYALINIGLLYMIEKEYSYAESNFMEALRIYNLISFEDCIDYPFLLSKIFTLYHITGRYDEAETIFDQTSNIFYRIVERYFAGMSDKEKTNLLDKINDFYEEYNSFAIDRLSETPHIIGKLYEKRLQTKGLLYTAGNSIKNNLLKSKDSILLGKYNSWISIKEYLAGLITNRSDKIRKNKNYIDSLIDVANSMEKELARYSSSFNSYKMKSLFTDYKWENIRNKLDSNEASIEIIRFRYFSDTFSENIYYAFIIVTKGTKDYPDIVILKDGNKLENECLSGYKRGLQKNDLHNSFKRYWEKVDLVLDKYFKNNEERKLFIANDGVYNQINVGALMPVKNKFLIQKYDIRNIRSTREIVESKNNEKTFFSFDKKAVIFGAPNYSKNMIANTAQGKMAVKNKINIISDKVLSVNSLIKRSGLSNKTFEKLPGAEKEIKEISKILSSNGWDVSLFSGDNASEEEVKSIQNPNILHLAIHGLFMEDIKTSSKYYNFNERILLDDPMYRSMLFFSGVNDILSGNRVKNKTQDSYSGEDGILTAKEIQNLSLDSSELVVVAACQSGKGVLRNMEGIYGMERAFFLSGAKNVIVSLWLVDDLIASDLMIRFYRNWMKCNDKHKAFRKAQLELIENGTKSYDWAVFMMIGM